MSVLLSGMAATAMAADIPMVGMIDPNFAACYAREYDAAHMKEHPKQKVTGIAFSYLPGAYAGVEDGGPALAAVVTVTMKGGSTKLSGDAWCKPGKGSDVDCIIDEDGGSFTLSQGENGNTLTNASGFSVAPNTGDHDADMAKRVSVDPKDDHETFLLSLDKSTLCNG